MRLVITDLDGTLLDHDTYSFAEAQPALDLLRRLRVPVIFTSSKTRAEILMWRDLMGNRHPFISENGGAVFYPQGYFPQAPEADIFGDPYPELVRALGEASIESGCRVTGFAQMTVENVARECGMTLAMARLARQREFDEPFLVHDQERLDALLAAIASRGKRHTRGGRFHHITGKHDKAAAVRKLAERFRAITPDVETIGLGDGLNDAQFLNAVDIPVLVRSASTEKLKAAVPRGTVTRECGPGGWRDAILELFPQP
ncbi:MAG: HAD-IIB family hydrolase [Bryobacterales bacterium]|nr:HAD-IIB family hydrolase [Bryobacterales bacterium]